MAAVPFNAGMLAQAVNKAVAAAQAQ